MSQTQWMIRRPDLRILRPISQAELVQRIQSGEISPSDELCPANGYWFMLSEVNEVRQHLGDINLGCLHQKDLSENTSSDTHPIQKTSIIPPKVAAPVVKKSRPSMVETISTPQVNEVPRIAESDAALRAKRIKNASGVAVVFLVFIAVLVLFWLGSY